MCVWGTRVRTAATLLSTTICFLASPLAASARVDAGAPVLVSRCGGGGWMVEHGLGITGLPSLTGSTGRGPAHNDLSREGN